MVKCFAPLQRAAQFKHSSSTDTNQLMTTEVFPESLALTDDDSVLQITWDDGHVSRLRLDVLRAECPCASCKGHHPSQSLNLTAEQFPDIRITDLAPVGRYAYSISWSDGHNTGLYTLRSLREMENSA
jgi:DUF971 family protein